MSRLNRNDHERVSYVGDLSIVEYEEISLEYRSKAYCYLISSNYLLINLRFKIKYSLFLVASNVHNVLTHLYHSTLSDIIFLVEYFISLTLSSNHF